MDKVTCLCLVGMAPDTANLGVSALCSSVISGLFRRIQSPDLTVWDNRAGVAPFVWKFEGNNIEVVRCGAYHTKRLYRPEALWNIRISAWLGGSWNAGVRSIRTAEVVLDVSGGDSFTDLYGAWRFRAVTLPKVIALEQRKPLVLLPQTYGPFETARARKVAQNIVRSAAMAWARDSRSFESLKELLGKAFDPERHRAGVDVAFILPVSIPAEEITTPVLEWARDKDTPLVGLNVSGLLLNRPKRAAAQYGLKADYRQVILSLIRRLFRESNARILLIPHVVSPKGHYESDIDACDSILTDLGAESASRIAIAPLVHDPCEVKWIIAQCDWFCGTRMHSTIAALSSGVPAAAISYSPKTLGVFETCAQGSRVGDPRILNTEELSDHLWRSWQERESARESLQAALPVVLQQAEAQLNAIVEATLPGPAPRPVMVR